MKALCIHPSSPKGRFQGTAGVDFPDTLLYGYNHLAAAGIDADLAGRDDALPPALLANPLARLIGFRTRHLLLFFKARSYDIVFGSALLYLMPLKKLFGGKARYVLLNMELVRILRTNAHRWFRRRLLRSLVGEFAGIICLSHAQEEWLRANYPFLEGKLYFVPLGVDTRFYQPTYEGRGDAVLSVGRDNGRDYGTLLSAAAQMPDTRFEIVCGRASLDPDAVIPPNVRVFYELSFQELTEKYRTARMLVLTTHDDSFLGGADCSGQTVLLDGMANGLPVIVSRKAYLDDYVRDGEDALIVDCYAPDQIVAAVRKLEDASLRLKLARSARNRAENEFSTAVMGRGITEILRTVSDGTK